MYFFSIISLINFSLHFSFSFRSRRSRRERHEGAGPIPVELEAGRCLRRGKGVGAPPPPHAFGVHGAARQPQIVERPLRRERGGFGVRLRADVAGGAAGGGAADGLLQNPGVSDPQTDLEEIRRMELRLPGTGAPDGADSGAFRGGGDERRGPVRVGEQGGERGVDGGDI